MNRLSNDCQRQLGEEQPHLKKKAFGNVICVEFETSERRNYILPKIEGIELNKTRRATIKKTE